jgi:hypothetical protein
MAKLTKEEEDQLAALAAKRDAPDDDDGDQGDGDDADGHVFVLSGSRADRFLESIIGTPKPKKAAPGKPPAGDGKTPPADTDGDETPPADEPPPKRAPRYFR